MFVLVLIFISLWLLTGSFAWTLGFYLLTLAAWIGWEAWKLHRRDLDERKVVWLHERRPPLRRVK